jgi:hypothetical protein
MWVGSSLEELGGWLRPAAKRDLVEKEQPWEKKPFS